LDGLRTEGRTTVFFESPRRLAVTLADAVEVLGGTRAAAVCRELTKTYEEIRRGPLGELAEWSRDGVRGEITVVVAGAPPAPREHSAQSLAALVAAREEAGEHRKTAIAEVAARLGLPKRRVFDAVVAARAAADPQDGDDADDSE
jgi:16S rRNA (cytidine1402-2'-O)-methyltransferase